MPVNIHNKLRALGDTEQIRGLAKENPLRLWRPNL